MQVEVGFESKQLLSPHELTHATLDLKLSFCVCDVDISGVHNINVTDNLAFLLPKTIFVSPPQFKKECAWVSFLGAQTIVVVFPAIFKSELKYAQFARCISDTLHSFPFLKVFGIIFL